MAVSARIRIVNNRFSDYGTFAATSEARPAANLKAISRGKVWQSTDTADQALTGDFGQTRNVGSCILWRHNLTTDALWRLRLWDGPDQTGTVVFDSTALQAVKPKTLGALNWGIDPLGASRFTGWRLAYSVLWFTAVNARSWQLDLSDAGNGDGYLQAARLVIGAYLSSAVNFDYGIKLKWEDPSQVSRTDGGSARTNAFEKYRRMELNLGHIRDNERAKFSELGRTTGVSEEVFISAYPARDDEKERDHSFMALIENPIEGTHPYYDNHAYPLAFLET